MRRIESLTEICSCGAVFHYAGPLPFAFLTGFRDQHRKCREKHVTVPLAPEQVFGGSLDGGEAESVREGTRRLCDRLGSQVAEGTFRARAKVNLEADPAKPELVVVQGRNASVVAMQEEWLLKASNMDRAEHVPLGKHDRVYRVWRKA